MVSTLRLLCCALIISFSTTGATGPVGTKEQYLETSKVTVQVGQVHRVTLGGLSGAGYTWSYTIEGPPSVVSVSVEMTQAPAMPPPGGPPPDSFSRDYIYAITGLKPGRATVRFTLAQEWEHDKPPLREMVVDVSVGQ